jgi:hypothetical protein
MNISTRETMGKFGDQRLIHEYETLLASPAWKDYTEQLRLRQQTYDTCLHTGKASDSDYIARQQEGYDNITEILSLPETRMQELAKAKGDQHHA